MERITLNRVPCVEINCENFELSWPSISGAIKSCEFIALDFEMSGLGDKNTQIFENIQRRYEAIAEISKTRSILSVGISIFKYIAQNSDRCEWRYIVENYTILARCLDAEVYDRDAVDFLLTHGFDFDNHAAKGVPYSKRVDPRTEDLTAKTLRNLIALMIAARKPIVVHNGLIDLVYFYDCFHCPLPNDLQVFSADMSSMFPFGIFDTKYISGTFFNQAITFLAYTFFVRQRINLQNKVSDREFVGIKFQEHQSLQPWTQYQNVQASLLVPRPKGIKPCYKYGRRGWCIDGDKCQYSHDIDMFIDEMSQYQNPSSRFKEVLKKVRKLGVLNDPQSLDNSGKVGAKSVRTMGYHDAGFDAFMTGFCFASFCSCIDFERPLDDYQFFGQSRDLKKITNRVHLVKNDDPLHIRKSPYTKFSLSSQTRMQMIKNHKSTLLGARV